jgi:hypothetical protein
MQGEGDMQGEGGMQGKHGEVGNCSTPMTQNKDTQKVNLATKA